MAAPPVCRNCGSALPRAALFCPKCGRPVFLLTGRRARRARDASLVGMAGALLLAAQAVIMLGAGVVALVALRMATQGDLTGATGIASSAAVAVGVALLFDLVGVSMIAGAFSVHTRTARAGVTLAANDPERRALAVRGLLATVFLVLWLLVTLVWRGTLAAIVSFYPSPLGIDLGGVGAAELRRAASVMLGLWVAAAFLLFLGATFGSWFLRSARGTPLTVWRLLWPLETFVHFCAAVAIAAIAPGLLARPRIDLTTLQIVETLGFLELIIVPVLGILAYAFLFRDFHEMFRRSPWSPPAPAAPASAADPPGGMG